MNKHDADKVRFKLDLIVLFVTVAVLVFVFFFVGGAQGAPPPRTAQPIPAQRAHYLRRERYLMQGCAALDFWHVICPMAWTKNP